MSFLPPVIPTTFTTLKKNIRNVFIPAQPGEPGSPGRPFVPAYSGVSTFEVCNYVAYTPAEYQALLLAAGGRIEYTDQGIVYFPPQGGIQMPPTSRRVCTLQSVVVNYPAQAAIPATPATPSTPAQNILDLQLGWNARAHSIVPMTHSGVFRFKVASNSQGVVVGLTTRPLSSGFSDMRWAFYVEQGILRIYENGVAIETIGPYAAGTQLALVRRNSVIEYHVGGVIERTQPNVDEPLYLGAAFYAGDDAVYEASFSEFGTANGEVVLSPVQAFGGDTDYAIGETVLLPVYALGGSDPYSSGAVVMLPVTALGADSVGYGSGSVVLMPVTSEGEGLALAPYVVSGAVVLLPVIVQGVGTSGGVGNGEVVLEPVFAIGSDYPYSYGSVMMLPVTSYGEDYSLPSEASMFSQALVLGGTESQAVIVVVFNSNMTLAGVIAATPMNDGLMPGPMTLSTPYLTQAELAALLASLMSARGVASDEASDLTVWTMNMDNNGGTRYTNYNFNSFAKIGSKYFGASSAGLFELSGPDDDGVDVDTEINFGNLKFGTTLRKAMPYCYVGVASDGKLVLKVEADGETYYYDVRDHDELLDMQRFKLGRGLRAVYYNFTLLNYGGSAFDLASIEFTPLPLTRRL